MDTLFRKDIDDKPPYPFMKLRCDSKMGSILRYSNLHKRIIANEGGKNLLVINPKTRKVEMRVKRTSGGKTEDLLLVGEHRIG